PEPTVKPINLARSSDNEVNREFQKSLKQKSLKHSSDDDSRNSKNMGSSYVPLDSWIYPAIERLVALGMISNRYLSIRPWTRLECARLLEEAETSFAAVDDASMPTNGYQTYTALAEEFREETARLDGARNLAA